MSDRLTNEERESCTVDAEIEIHPHIYRNLFGRQYAWRQVLGRTIIDIIRETAREAGQGRPKVAIIRVWTP